MLKVNKDGIRVANLLKEGEIVILPTDTIYGICTSIYSDKKNIKKIYEMKKRETSKSMIVLVSSIDQAISMWSKPTIGLLKIINSWPERTTIVFPANKEHESIADSEGYLAIRVVYDKSIVEIINISGPIFSTSANISSKDTVRSFNDALKVFGSKCKNIVYGIPQFFSPSKIIKVTEDDLIIKIR